MADYDFTEIAREVAEKENVKDYKIAFKYSTNKGDGYLGSVKAVELIGKNKTLNLVFKYSHRDPKTHETLPLRDAYLNEINYYRLIAPTFTKFQNDHNIDDPFNNSPKYYGCVLKPKDELLALENITCDNYDLWDRNKTMNRDHLEVALRTFAKFHGTSYAMQKLNPQMYKDLCSTIPDDLMQKFFVTMKFYEQMAEVMRGLLDIFDAKSEKIYIDKLSYFADNIKEEVETLLEYREDSVILQGDCWCNNAMYQYEDMNDRTKPKNMKMLDYQMIGLGSPAFDLAYFFYSIAQYECIEDLEYFQKLYHTELGKHLMKFNLDVNEILTFEKFMTHWRRVSRYGLILTLIVRKAMLTDSADAPDITEGAEDFIKNFHINPEKQKIYDQQIREIVMHFVDRKLI